MANLESNGYTSPPLDIMSQHETPVKPCPFCGSQPRFSDVEYIDDRRYVQMELECCVTMSAVLGYQKYSGMTDKAIHAVLTDRLTKHWNIRNG